MIGLNKYLIGAVCVMGVTLAGLWGYLDHVAGERDKWRQTASTNAATITALQAEAERTDTILTALRDTQQSIRDDSARTRRALTNLEASNEAVRSLLDTPVPDDLAGVVWGDAEDGDDPTDAAGKPDDAVQGERP